MTRTVRTRLLILFALCAAVWITVPASVHAATDPTAISLSCTPSSVSAGSATSCTVTVTDTVTSSTSAPSGPVTFSADESGSFSDSGSCTLATTGAASAACTVTFTPSEGGDDTISASFGGDSAHSASVGSTTVGAVDATATALACDSASLAINTDMTCTATITDNGSPLSPTGEVAFTTSGTGASFTSPGLCPWTPTASGVGGTGSCQVNFSATAPGTYTLTATYGGDGTHAASSGTTQVVVTTTPTDGGPEASDPGGVALPTAPLTPSPRLPTPGSVRIAAGTIKVSTRRVAGVRLSCVGDRGATCQGTLGLTALITSQVKVKTRVKVKIKIKVHHRTRTKTVTRTRTKLSTVSTLVTLGTVDYTLSAGSTRTESVRLSRLSFTRILAARHQRLQANAAAAGVIRAVVLTPAHKPKPKQPPEPKKKKKGKPVKTHTPVTT